MYPPHNGEPTQARKALTPQAWTDTLGNNRPIFVLSFWFEWRSETAFWPANDAAQQRFGIGSIVPEDLPLGDDMRQRVRELARWHDTSLNWVYPPDPGPWRQEECDRFNAAVDDLFSAVTRQLGPQYYLVKTQEALEEDPELDAYLRNPAGFRRHS